MSHPIIHAKSSAKKFGGIWEDYIHLHNWLDATKAWYGHSLHRLFKEIGENGEGIIQFQGGGDDGEIEKNITINGSLERVPKLIYDMVYQWLIGTGIDWYNNEGGQGNFVFRPKHSEIVLNVEQNYEENVNVPMDFKIHF